MKADGKTTFYDGVVRILCKNRGKTVHLAAMGTTEDHPITLDECLKLIDYTDGVCTVIFDEPLHGSVYQYGNYGPYWVKYGETQGFA